MATILEVGADGETWRSEHSGRTVTSTKVTTADPETGDIRFGEAQQHIWNHENADYADARKALQVGVENPVLPGRPARPAAGVTISAEEWAAVQALLAGQNATTAGDEGSTGGAGTGD